MTQPVENPVFARVFHRFFGRDRGRGEAALRRELLASARGRVVEVGAGNGINFEHYPEGVDELIAVEPEPYLRGQAERAAAGAAVTVRVTSGTAAELGLVPGSADAVVVSGVLCSVPDQAAASRSFAGFCAPEASCASSSTCARGEPDSPAGNGSSTRSGRG